jgi:hypothetical protein
MEYDLVDIRGRVFYGQSQAEALEGVLRWLAGQSLAPIDLHIIEFDTGQEDTEMAIVFYEQSP